MIKGPTNSELIEPGKEEEIEFSHIYDENLNELECARHPREIIKIKTKTNYPENSMIRVKF